jgi:hypothetical protein
MSELRVESIFGSMNPGVPNEISSREDLQLANLTTIPIALWCVRAFWALKAAMLGHKNLGASKSESASASSETGLGTDALYAVVSSFKKHHPELWGAVRDLGIQMPGLPVLSSVETEVVERVDWC